MGKEKSSKQPKVVILLAAYNGEAWLEEQIDSILGQTGVVVDIFISVDLSTDKTYELCRKYQSQYACIQVLPYGERFGCAAQNFYRLIKEVDLSGYEYLALADQDDIWLPHKLIRAINVMQKKSSEAYSSDVTAFWASGQTKVIKKSYQQKKYDYLFEAAGPGCSYVLSVSSFLSFQAYLIQNQTCHIAFHDWLIYAYYRHTKRSWYIDSQADALLYRQHSNNQLGVNYGLKAYIRRFKMMKNDWYCSQVRGIIQILECFRPMEIAITRGSLVRHFLQLRRRPRDAWSFLILLCLGLCR